MAKRYTDEFRRGAVRMATTSGLERFQFSLQQGYRQCPESAEGVAGYWRSNINWKRFRWQKPLGIRTKGRVNAFRDRNVNATSPTITREIMASQRVCVSSSPPNVRHVWILAKTLYASIAPGTTIPSLRPMACLSCLTPPNTARYSPSHRRTGNVPRWTAYR